jgi:TetR/AcrR family transcriptional regulator, cholesterol catabolism regulator
MTSAIETTSDRLLDVAARLFREKGYAATTTRELAEALGIQKASLYHHISNKEQLLFDISIESLRRITEAVAGASATAQPERRLEAVIERHVEMALRDRDLHTTMLFELRSLSPEHAAHVREGRDRYEALLEGVLRDEQLQGRLRTDIDSSWLTKTLLNLLNWTIFWFDPSGEQSPRDLARILATVFLEGTRIEAR